MSACCLSLTRIKKLKHWLTSFDGDKVCSLTVGGAVVGGTVVGGDFMKTKRLE